MEKLHDRIEDVLTMLYDYSYIDLDKFYNNKGNKELLEVLNNVNNRGYAKREEMETLQDLHDSIDSFIKFETNDNSRIGDF